MLQERQNNLCKVNRILEKKKKEIQINLISTTFHLRLSLKGR